MKKKNKIRFDLVSLIFALVITILSAAPLFSEHTSDAKLIAIIFGSVATGAMLSNLIHDLKRKRDDK